MNQIEKRLHIIKLAISLTDEECINQQRYKLMGIKNDPRLDEILEQLANNNYAQAQHSIITYLQEVSSDDTVADHIPTPPLQTTKTQQDKESSHSFGSDIDALLEQAQKHSAKRIETAEEIERFARSSSPDLTADTQTNQTLTFDIDPQEVLAHTDENPNTNQTPQSQTPQTAPLQSPLLSKYRTLIRRWAPHIDAQTPYKDTQALFECIKSGECDDTKIYNAYTKLTMLKNEGQSEEASALLVALYLTDTQLGKLITARDLLKGELLQKEIQEGFEIIRELALNEEFDEAICDLAQLYEYGLGVKKDIDTAMRLYTQASALGLERAQKHLRRIEGKQKRWGLF